MIKKAQSTLELTLSILAVMLLFFGMFRLLLWSTRSMVGRHKAYKEKWVQQLSNTAEVYGPEPIELVPNLIRQEAR